MSNPEKFATCCMLSFNRRQFVEEAILTLIGNAHYPLELIVHDDGSDDPGVREVLRNFVDSGAISTLIENPPGWNQGQGVALNRMFHMAQGDPIIKLDHDLIFQPGWLRTCVEILDANASNPTQPEIGSLGLFKYTSPPVHHEEMHIKSWEGFDEVEDYVGSAMVIPRVAWEEFGPFDQHSPAFAEDNVFKMKIKDAPQWCNALTPHDVAVNQGFGPGPSTVVTGYGPDDVAKIHFGPRIVESTK